MLAPADRSAHGGTPLDLSPYEASLMTGAPLTLQHGQGSDITLDVGRWLSPADEVDHSALRLVDGPVLDLGCGPGRIVEALLARGVPALGVDLAPAAVRIARARGVPALRRDLFSRLPREGRWGTAVLLDGNIGIGGEPAVLLERARSLITARGSVVVETHGDDDLDVRLMVRFTRDGRPVGAAFPWAVLGRRGLESHAAEAGLETTDTVTGGGRTFVALRGRGPRVHDSGIRTVSAAELA